MKKVLKFGAEWCPTCKAQAKLLTTAGIPFEDIDVDENEELTQKYNIKGLPTIVITNEEGEELSRFNGLTQAKDIKEALV